MDPVIRDAAWKHLKDVLEAEAQAASATFQTPAAQNNDGWRTD